MIRLIHVDRRAVARLGEANVHTELIRLHQLEGAPDPTVNVSICRANTSPAIKASH